MRSVRRSRRRQLRVNAEINFTNLIDVAFVLLIIFMITAPILQGGIELDLPRAEANPLTSSEAVVVSVSGTGEIFVDQAPVRIEEFRSVFAMYMQSHEGQPVSVKIDREARYERVAQVLGILMGMGIETVNLPVEPAAGEG